MFINGFIIILGILAFPFAFPIGILYDISILSEYILETAKTAFEFFVTDPELAIATFFEMFK